MNRTLLAFAVCFSCTTAQPPATPAVEPLGATQHLVRASMALKGTRPSLDELRAVAADPKALEAIVDRYLESPELGATMRDLHNEALLTRSDAAVFPLGFPALGPLAAYDLTRINGSLAEEPLKLIEWVVTHDRPYSEIVTADYALADGVVAAVHGMPHSPDLDAWEKTTWPEGHAAAGVLSSPLLFTRHSTTVSNANRGRANVIARALLCYDFTSRDVEVDASINLADPEAVAKAVRSNPACASCHQTLDPLAAYFSVYSPTYVPASITGYPIQYWVSETTTPFWISQLGMTRSTPGFFGRRGEGLKNLGALIAADPRFSLCAVKRFLSYFTQRRLEEVNPATVARLNDVFVDSGLSAKALARAVVLSDEFKQSHAAGADGADDVVGYHQARPEQLARLVADLTGFQWQTDVELSFNGRIGRVNLVTDSFIGFEVQAGGIDSFFVTQPSHTYNTTASLFLRAFSEEAAHQVVETELASADRSKRRLLTKIDAGDTSQSAVRAQLADLHGRIYGRLDAPESEAVGDTYSLFTAALAGGSDTRRAWKTTLAAMLQDFAVAYF